MGVVGGGCRGERLGWGGQGGCKRRIEVFVKIQKKNGGSGLRVWVGVNEELKFWGKIKKKNVWGGPGGRVGGQDGCERRIEVFVKIQKKKLGGSRGGGSGWGGGGSGWM